MLANLTFYYGQEITAVEPEGDGWALVLESGARIVNLDPEYEMPDNALVGMKVSKATFSAGSTVLYVGPSDNPLAAQINLTPTKYGIEDMTYGAGLSMPQDTTEEVAADIPQAAPGKRIVDEPDPEGEAARAEPDPEYVPDED